MSYGRFEYCVNRIDEYLNRIKFTLVTLNNECWFLNIIKRNKVSAALDSKGFSLTKYLTRALLEFY